MDRLLRPGGYIVLTGRGLSKKVNPTVAAQLGWVPAQGTEHVVSVAQRGGCWRYLLLVPQALRSLAHPRSITPYVPGCITLARTHAVTQLAFPGASPEHAPMPHLLVAISQCGARFASSTADSDSPCVWACDRCRCKVPVQRVW
eukprot:364976-Chlamydomonas_euryale.AAC.11